MSRTVFRRRGEGVFVVRAGTFTGSREVHAGNTGTREFHAGHTGTREFHAGHTGTRGEFLTSHLQRWRGRGSCGLTS